MKVLPITLAVRRPLARPPPEPAELPVKVLPITLAVPDVVGEAAAVGRRSCR